MTLTQATIRAYDAGTHTATVEIPGPRITYLTGIAHSNEVDPADLTDGTQCILLMWDETDPAHSLIIATV